MFTIIINVVFIAAPSVIYTNNNDDRCLKDQNVSIPTTSTVEWKCRMAIWCLVRRYKLFVFSRESV